MKLLISTLLTINCFFSFAQIEALFDLKRFQSTDQNYIETYLYIYGNTLKESVDTSNRKKSVEILQYIENEEKELAQKLSDKYGRGSLDIETGTFTPAE